ncbi:putative MFS transporter [Virgibacillus halotolerans]|uniref:MFS transporter n=1 Tax=Virgibacillus halotolerans TaxID=1071053 RepID=UPI0019612AE7|nr:putative MFS transporter [Virgibacillus halotolerans]
MLEIDRKQEIADLNARIDRLPRTGLRGITFMLIGLSYFFMFYDLSIQGFIIPTIAEEFNLTSTQTAIPISFYLLGYPLGGYFLAVYGDRVGRRQALLITVIVVAFGSLMTALSWDMWSLTFFRFLVGAGSGAEIALASTITAEFSPAKKRGKYLQMMYFWGAGGLTLTPFISLALIDFQYGWRIITAIGGIVAILLIFLRKNHLPESPRWLVANNKIEEAKKQIDEIERFCEEKTGEKLPEVYNVPIEQENEGNELKTLFKPPYVKRVIITLLFWCLWLVATNGYLTYGPTIISNAGAGLVDGNLFAALGYLGTPVGAILAFWFVDSLERKVSMFIITVIFAVGLILITFTHSTLLVFLGAFFISFCIAAQSIAYGYMAEIFPTRIRATGVVVTDSGGNLTGIVTPFIIVGLLSLVGGIGTLIALSIIVFASGLVILIGGEKTTGVELTRIAEEKKSS